ncbi:MAG: thiopurine S-methyltransferase [Nitrospinae bacterium]|nr:thiopurine S-methyltransferase [Nitrospinota bacterium]
MDHDFWLRRWEENLIGFHQSEVNAHLKELWDKFEVPGESVAFVPMCGKSLDMLWLRSRGLRVMGVELSELAVASFFAGNGLKPETRVEGSFKIYKTEGVEIFCGDFFSLEKGSLSSVRFVYDRAALVALPPDMRKRYADDMAEKLPKNAVMALLALEYEQGEMEGPPFSVPEKEVVSLFSENFKIEKLRERDVSGADMETFRKRGLGSLLEKVYKLKN